MYNRLKPLFLLLVLFAACSQPKEKIPPAPAESAVSRKPVIYQLMTRLFGNKAIVNKPYGTLAENGVGKFNDITEGALKGIQDLGVTHVWFTGVIEHAQLTDYTRYGIALDHPDVVKGRAGSPYAIKDYYDVDPDLATDVPNRMKEFEQLVDRTHNAGLKVLIDFVPNHVARVYNSDAKPTGVDDLGAKDDPSVAFKVSNNFYYLPGQTFRPPYNPIAWSDLTTFHSNDGKFKESPAKVSGNDQFTATPTVNDWYETVKLNYGVDIQQGRKTYFDPVPDTWIKMKDILKYWAKKQVDGFRCDMAEMVPVEFWAWVIPQVKEINPSIIFVAEIYNPSVYRDYVNKGGFDFLYDKVQLYDQLRLLITQKGKTDEIAKTQESLKGLEAHLVHFLENHDEQRIASPFFAGDPWKAIPAMVVSACIDKSPVMIYFGQEVGENASGAEGFSGNDGRTTMFDYWGVPSHQAWMNDGKFDGGKLSDDQRALRQFYGDILTFASTNPAIVSGEYFDLTLEGQSKGTVPSTVYAFARTYEQENLLVVVNFGSAPAKASLQLSPKVVDAMKLNATTKYVGRDLLRSGSDIGFATDFSTSVELPAFSAFIFKIKS